MQLNRLSDSLNRCGYLVCILRHKSPKKTRNPQKLFKCCDLPMFHWFYTGCCHEHHGYRPATGSSCHLALCSTTMDNTDVGNDDDEDVESIDYSSTSIQEYPSILQRIRYPSCFILQSSPQPSVDLYCLHNIHWSFGQRSQQLKKEMKKTHCNSLK